MNQPIQYTRTSYANREEWLSARHGIGASEIGAAIGCGFKTRNELWKEKTGVKKPKDLSDNERVKFGNDSEDSLRGLFRVMQPDYELSFDPFTIYRPVGEYDFLFYTPDGELIERSTGRRGLYESKTAFCISRRDWEKWESRVPENYLYQISQGAFCGNFEFAVVFALLIDQERDGVLRAYHIERDALEGRIEIVKKEGKAFWRDVTSRNVPPVKLTL